MTRACGLRETGGGARAQTWTWNIPGLFLIKAAGRSRCFPPSAATRSLASIGLSCLTHTKPRIWAIRQHTAKSFEKLDVLYVQAWLWKYIKRHYRVIPQAAQDCKYFFSNPSYWLVGYNIYNRLFSPQQYVHSYIHPLTLSLSGYTFSINTARVLLINSWLKTSLPPPVSPSFPSLAPRR